MLKYDKLKNMTTEEVYWDFSCPSCKADGQKKNNFTIKPIGVSWKPDDVDHISTGNLYIDRNLKKLPTFREAVLKVMSKGNSIDLLFICNNCENVFNIHENVQLSDVKKWLNKHHPFKMRLGMTQDERDKYKQRNLHSQNISKRIPSPQVDTAGRNLSV